jgi:hypothetical protein
MPALRRAAPAAAIRFEASLARAVRYVARARANVAPRRPRTTPPRPRAPPWKPRNVSSCASTAHGTNATTARTSPITRISPCPASSPIRKPAPQFTNASIYYDVGVGTGLLDGITGGGFGIGLEDNVREAYNWLVEHFNDSGSEGTYTSDEIFVFGFSRGAYTARSLVGFIGRCGLLRRGSPISVNELWQAYCELGRLYEERRSAWDHVPSGALPFRERNELSPDPWKEQKSVPNLSDKEKLLVTWSRRVRITFLGVYDTVGAMGVDALAIPGIRSRVAMHHNMRPTSLIQKCRHALAIHEHRSSFAHTPLVAYDFKQASDLTPADWAKRIEQRWFAGAHSNIGGGYETNTLALRPLIWMLEGASAAGLQCRALSSAACPAPEMPEPRDSYGEFARGLPQHLLRMKPNYRPIVPSTERRAPAARNGSADQAFELTSINETVDHTVKDFYARNNVLGAPPNLVRHARAKVASDPDWAPVAKNARTHCWPKAGFASEVWTAWWAAAATLGLAQLLVFFSGEKLIATWPWLAGFAGFIVLIDWVESRLNHRLAEGEIDTSLPGLALLRRLAHRTQPGLTGWLDRRLGHLVEPQLVRQATPAWVAAIADSVYWTRSLGVVFSVAGLLALVSRCFQAGWVNGNLTWQMFPWMEMKIWTTFAIAGWVALLLGRFADANYKGWATALAGTIATALVFPLLAALAALAAKICDVAPVETQMMPMTTAQAHGAHYLLLLIALAYLARSFGWVAEPFARINTGDFLSLQLARTPDQLRELLESWRLRLTLPGEPEDKADGPAARRIRGAIAEATWRDVIGFVPVYTLVLGYGLAMATDWANLRWFNQPVGPAPLWFWIIVGTALADLSEDWFHFGYLAAHAEGRTPTRLAVGVSWTLSMLKSVGFVTAAALTAFVALPLGWVRLWEAPGSVGWAGSIGILVPMVALAFMVWLAIQALLKRK